jgi:hypothetical protein
LTRIQPSGFHTNISGKLNVDSRVSICSRAGNRGVFVRSGRTRTRQIGRRFHSDMQAEFNG